MKEPVSVCPWIRRVTSHIHSVISFGHVDHLYSPGPLSWCDKDPISSLAVSFLLSLSFLFFFAFSLSFFSLLHLISSYFSTFPHVFSNSASFSPSLYWLFLNKATEHKIHEWLMATVDPYLTFCSLLFCLLSAFLNVNHTHRYGSRLHNFSLDLKKKIVCLMLNWWLSTWLKLFVNDFYTMIKWISQKQVIGLNMYCLLMTFYFGWFINTFFFQD